MNSTVKAMTLGLMAFAMAGVILAVSPQLMSAQAPRTDANAPAGTAAASAASQSDLVDAYNWRTTISPPKNPRT